MCVPGLRRREKKNFLPQFLFYGSMDTRTASADADYASPKYSPDALLSVERAVLASEKAALRGALRGVVAFAIPHEEQGEVVGIAASCAEGCRPNLGQIRSTCAHAAP